ncbi:protein vacuoleless1 [Tanacetum coccineum]
MVGLRFLQVNNTLTPGVAILGVECAIVDIEDVIGYVEGNECNPFSRISCLKSSIPQPSLFNALFFKADIFNLAPALAIEALISVDLLLSGDDYGQFQRKSIQEMSKTLRVLNAVGSPEIGIPLGIQKNKLLTPSVLIGRLVNAHQHLLALKISYYLGMKQEVVIMQWACSKLTVSSAILDPTLLEILLDKLKLCRGISYAAVAAHADLVDGN